MKTAIHPKYYTESTFTCACGATYVMGSTKDKHAIEICSACHPFYTGNEKIVDTAGRVEKFKARTAAAAAAPVKAKTTAKKATKSAK